MPLETIESCCRREFVERAALPAQRLGGFQSLLQACNANSHWRNPGPRVCLKNTASPRADQSVFGLVIGVLRKSVSVSRSSMGARVVIPAGKTGAGETNTGLKVSPALPFATDVSRRRRVSPTA